MRNLIICGVALALLLGCAMLIRPLERNAYEVEGTRLFMSGEINEATLASFEAQMQAHPHVQTIVLMDMPGSVDEEAVHDLGYFIRDAGLDTHLTPQSEIYSGAVDLFLAGNRRTMTCCAKIGVHDWADDDGDGSSYSEASGAHDANIDYFNEMLGNDAFYWFTLQAAPSEDMHLMTPNELERFGLFTAPLEN